jgi:hypothetical protein
VFVSLSPPGHDPLDRAAAEGQTYRVNGLLSTTTCSTPKLKVKSGGQRNKVNKLRTNGECGQEEKNLDSHYRAPMPGVSHVSSSVSVHAAVPVARRGRQLALS